MPGGDFVNPDPQMRNCMMRLATFCRLPESASLSPSMVSKAGFYYTADGDTVTCHSCGLRLNLLEAGVYPMDAHRQLSSECPLAVSQQSAPMAEDTAQALSTCGAPEQVSTNEVNSQTASLGSTMAVQSISRETNHAASSRGPQRFNRHHRHGHNRRQNHNSQVASFIGGNNRSMHYRSLPPVPPFTSLTVLGPISGHGTGDSSVDMLEINSLSHRDSLLANNNSPRRMMERINNNDPSLLDEMRYERCRVVTYSNWPRDTNIEPEALAQAGLFYLYRADRVKCAFCYGILRNWESSEEPTRKHRCLFPTCSFLRNPRAAGNVALGEELTEEQTQVSNVTISRTLYSFKHIYLNII